MEMKLFYVYMDNGVEYEENVQGTEVIVARNLEEARMEAVKVMMNWEFCKCDTVHEFVKRVGSEDEPHNSVDYWADWVNGKKVKEYAVSSCRHLGGEDIPWFLVEELKLANGYEIESVKVRKVEDKEAELGLSNQCDM
ncbi:hypothetical protein [Bacillus thuringiensis]|uniref:hypothetical protein n=1 Tax=Bacillus thuringiensis TaxID=1428 RepID=UPI000BFD4699|nr:hypothetical protein [Bacillus thuringiensis]PGT89825.1 hypothetical protein COD17_08740 [Bacillus thuringiensis]